MEDKEYTEDTFWQEYRYGKSLRIIHTGCGSTHTVTRINYETEYDEEGQITGRETYSISGPFALQRATEVFREWVANELNIN